MKTNKKKCKGNYRSNNFPGCGEEKFIHKYGLCNSCYGSFLYSTPEGNNILKKTIPRAKQEVEKQKKREHVKAKRKSKTLSTVKNELQTLINKIARLIDTGKGCHSCNHGWDGNFTRQIHGGHFYSVGSNEYIRFNIFNIYSQCSICNHRKGGAITD